MKNEFEHIDEAVLGAYLSGNISDEGRKQVEKWLEESASHQEMLEALRKVWQITNPDNDAISFDTNLAWERLQQRMQQDKPPIKLPSQDVAGRFSITRMAAIFIAIACMSWFAYVYLTDEKMITHIAQNNGEVIYLSDSSCVILEKGSVLTYAAAFSKDERRSNLEGKGFFKVRKDSNRPFYVETGTAEIRVLGTEFIAFSAKDSSSVFLKEGSVQVTRNDNKKATAVLQPGMQAVTTRKDKAIVVNEGIEVQAEVYSFEKRLVFQQTELIAVIKLLRELYKADIQIENKAIEQCLLTASFSQQNLEEMLEIIASTFQLDLKIINQTYFLSGEGC